MVDGYVTSTAYGTPDDAACAINVNMPGYPECVPNNIKGADGYSIGQGNDKEASWLQSARVGVEEDFYVRLILSCQTRYQILG